MMLGFWRRVSFAVVLLSFLMGTMGPAFPYAGSSQPCAMTMSSPDDTMPPCDDGAAKHPKPVCFDATGCLVSAKLPMVPASNWTVFAWTAIQYWLSVAVLNGRTVGPELHPPTGL